MEAHAWTLPRRTAQALSPKARKLLGLPWDHFLLHAHRVAALPRTPLDGARFVLDALLYGYEPYVHPRLFSNGLETAGLSPSLKWVVLASYTTVLQLQRWLAIACLLAPLVLSRCCAGPKGAGRDAGRASRRWRARLRSLACSPPVMGTACVAGGMCVGVNLALERVRM